MGGLKNVYAIGAGKFNQFFSNNIHAVDFKAIAYSTALHDRGSLGYSVHCTTYYYAWTFIILK